LSRRFHLTPPQFQRTNARGQLSILIGIAIGLVAGLILSWSGLFPWNSKTIEHSEVSNSYDQAPQRELIESSVTTTAVEETFTAKPPVTETSDTVSIGSNDAREPAEPAATAAVNQATDKPIRLQVLNGCGAKGITKRVAPGLRRLGFDVRESGNAKNYRHKTSKVYSRTRDISLAFRVADAVGIARSLVDELIDPALADIDVTLVIGADYSDLNFGLYGREGEEQTER
jgi:hypothetical protein